MYHQRFKSLDERFAEKFDVRPDGCWHWRGTDRDYPRICVGSGYVRANRFALERKLGRELVAGEYACHHCDNVRCVNPDHLSIGTHAWNMQDKAAKGRSRRLVGSENGRALLSGEDVRDILSAYAAGGVSQQTLADRYNVGQVTISHIIRRQTWKHIDATTLPTQGDLRTEGCA